MKRVALWTGIIAMLGGCVLQSANNKEDEGKKEEKGWIKMFDGKTLAGWHGYGHNDLHGRWKVADGVLSSDTTVKVKGVNFNLVSDEEYDNFHLKLDWKIAKNGNSGIIFYVHEDTSKYREPYETGLEMQVLDNAGHPDAKIIKHRAGDLYDLISCSTETVKPAGEWNHAEIICNNGQLDLFLNDTKVVSTVLWTDEWNKMVANSKFKTMKGFGIYKKGAICLQDHGDNVSYKNIMIKKL